MLGKADRILIDKIGQRSICVLVSEGKVVDLFGDPPELLEKSGIDFGAIYSAKVERKFNGTSGSILNLGKKKKGFIKNRKDFSVGESLIVQCVNMPNEGKLALFSKDILIKEKYLIFNTCRSGVSLSKKLRESKRFQKLQEKIIKEGFIEGSLGVILRSSCVNLSDEEIISQIRLKGKKYSAALEYSKKEPAILFAGYGARDRALAEWAHVQDKNIVESVDCFEPFDIWTILDKVKNEVVELKNGGFLSIEITRALTAVDINLGKCDSKNGALETNKLAMIELPKQLRLRGIGGVINIDFAPLRKKDRLHIVSILKRQLKDESIKTDIVGWSPLGNLELNRKNERIRIHEWLK